MTARERSLHVCEFCRHLIGTRNGVFVDHFVSIDGSKAIAADQQPPSSWRLCSGGNRPSPDSTAAFARVSEPTVHERHDRPGEAVERWTVRDDDLQTCPHGCTPILRALHEICAPCAVEAERARIVAIIEERRSLCAQDANPEFYTADQVSDAHSRADELRYLLSVLEGENHE